MNHPATRLIRTALRALSKTAKDDRLATQHWAERARLGSDQHHKITAWTESQTVMKHYVSPAISGEGEVGWFLWVARNFFAQPVETALSLGCGDGTLERHGILLGVAKRFDAFDSSDGALDVARAEAAKSGFDALINYRQADLNTHRLPHGTYDAAFASMSLHHIQDLEHVAEEVYRGLKPGALLVANEFVGPDRFQWTDKQVNLAQGLLESLPEQFRIAASSGGLKVAIHRPTVDQMINVDPTEAVRSSEIIPVLNRRFEVIARRDFGGTLLNLILEDIIWNFDESGESLEVLESLFEAERRLLRSGELDSDFTLLVAQRRD